MNMESDIRKSKSSSNCKKSAYPSALTLILLISAVSAALIAHKYWKRPAIRNYTKTYDDILSGLDVAETLHDHSQEFNEKVIYKVTEGVWVAVGYAIANTIMLEGPDGLIIVDTTESRDSAKQIWKDFKRIQSKPIKAIVYTHNHPDHVMGTKEFFDDSYPRPDIWAHHTLTSRWRESFITGNKIIWGSDRQFGTYLGEYLVNSGLGPFVSHEGPVKELPVPPNKLVVDEIQNEFIAGLNVTFLHIPGETYDQIAVWLPDKKVLLPGDNIYKTFPNLYAIRGTPPRDPLLWYKSLNKMRALNAEHLVPSHTRPVSGKSDISELFNVYMSGIEFIHDQTVRLLNKGLSPDEIAHRVQLPKGLRAHRYWREHYGRIQWAVKAVFERYTGWFSGDPVDLLPHSPVERSRRMIDMIGVDTLLDTAEQALKHSDPQWALETSSHVYRVDQNNMKAKDFRLQALRALAEREENAPARNFYLTTALADYNLIPYNWAPKEVLAKAPAGMLFDIMKRQLNAELSEDFDVTLGIRFTDTQENYKVKLRWSVIRVSTDAPTLRYELDHVESVPMEDCDVIITTNLPTWKAMWARMVSVDMAVASGKATVKGQGRARNPNKVLSQFFSMFDI